MAEKAKADGGVELDFARQKETKNTVRFQEVERDGEPIVIGQLYIQKHFAKAAKSVHMTLRA